MADALAVGLALGAAAGAAVAAGRTWTRALAAAALTVVALGAPLAAPSDHVLLRATLTLVALVTAFRVVDLVRDRRRWPVGVRLAMVFAFVDARSATRRRPALDLHALGAGLRWSALFAVALALAARASALGDPGLARAGRWAAGAVAFYAIAEAVLAAVRFAYHAAGAHPGRLHRTPALATSVRSFWSERWNLTVSRWLARHVFRPLARAGAPRLGVFAGFVASAAAHFVFALVPLGWTMAMAMGLFFLLHGALVELERALGVERWPRLARHAWTLAAFAATAPLFVEPTLRVLFDTREGVPLPLLGG